VLIENKILRSIYSIFTVYNELGYLRRRRNKKINKLTGVPRIVNVVKALRIKIFGHVMRWSNSENLKAVV